MTHSKTEKWIVSATGAIGLLALLLWGVPYYLKSQVHDLYVNEAEASPHPVTLADLAGNTAAVSALRIQLSSMEGRMIARDELFMQYLERQAASPE